MKRKSEVLNMGVCPHCTSGKIYVRSSQKPVRWWKCKVCGCSWKTTEIISTDGTWIQDFFDHLLVEGKLKDRPDIVQYFR